LFNGLPLNAGLIPGMQLKLPVIHPNGVLLPSSAPAPIALATTAPVGLPTANAIPQTPGIVAQAGAIGPQANLVQQAGGIAPQFGAPTQGAQFGPQAGGLPQGAQFAPQGAPMNSQMFNGAPSMTAPNGAPNMVQPNGPVATPSFDKSAAALNVAPTANIQTVASEQRLPSVAIGSILTLDGQSLGNERGIVRLRINGLALPIEVLDWNTTSVKIQLPQLDLAGAMKAEIEVMRADGSLASKSTVELTPATSRLALGN
jgi:hypothetical protein